ncbi:MAG: Hsp70 family protein, partial [Clostridia bacterium]|nr:Hsp70 family protein [Clostridia bacterium]
IEVTFDIDANGIVNVTACDKGTGKEQHITITSSTNMSKEDIEKAVKEAELHAAEDKLQKENVETKNNAENLVFQCEKTMADAGDKLTEEDKAPINSAVETLKESLKGEDYAKIKADTEALTQALYKISEKLYQAAGGAEGAQGFDPNAAGGAQGADGEGYYNADFTDASEDNK